MEESETEADSGQRSLPLAEDLPTLEFGLDLGVSLGTSENAPDWCDGCRRLRQEIKKLKDDHSLNYSALKQKIISTDLLIKKYRIKCDDILRQKDSPSKTCPSEESEEFDVQTKKNAELSKKLEKLQRDCQTLESQLKTSLQDMEPLKKMRNLLEEDVKQKKAEISHIKDQLKASEVARKQYELLSKSSTEQKENYEEERKSSVKKIQSLENSNKKLEASITKLRGENKTLKADLSSQQRKCKNLENQLNKQLEKQQTYSELQKYNDAFHKKTDIVLKTEPTSKVEKMEVLSPQIMEGPSQIDVMSDSSSEDEVCTDVPDFPMYWSPLAPMISPLPPSPYIPPETAETVDSENDIAENLTETEIIQTDESGDEAMNTNHESLQTFTNIEFQEQTVRGKEICKKVESELPIQSNSRGDTMVQSTVLDKVVEEKIVSEQAQPDNRGDAMEQSREQDKVIDKMIISKQQAQPDNRGDAMEQSRVQDNVIAKIIVSEQQAQPDNRGDALEQPRVLDNVIDKEISSEQQAQPGNRGDAMEQSREQDKGIDKMIVSKQQAQPDNRGDAMEQPRVLDKVIDKVISSEQQAQPGNRGSAMEQSRVQDKVIDKMVVSEQRALPDNRGDAMEQPRVLDKVIEKKIVSKRAQSNDSGDILEQFTVSDKVIHEKNIPDRAQPNSRGDALEQSKSPAHIGNSHITGLESNKLFENEKQVLPGNKGDAQEKGNILDTEDQLKNSAKIGDSKPDITDVENVNPPALTDKSDTKLISDESNGIITSDIPNQDGFDINDIMFSDKIAQDSNEINDIMLNDKPAQDIVDHEKTDSTAKQTVSSSSVFDCTVTYSRSSNKNDMQIISAGRNDIMLNNKPDEDSVDHEKTLSTAKQMVSSSSLLDSTPTVPVAVESNKHEDVEQDKLLKNEKAEIKVTPANAPQPVLDGVNDTEGSPCLDDDVNSSSVDIMKEDVQNSNTKSKTSNSSTSTPPHEHVQDESSVSKSSSSIQKASLRLSHVISFVKSSQSTTSESCLANKEDRHAPCVSSDTVKSMKSITTALRSHRSLSELDNSSLNNKNPLRRSSRVKRRQSVPLTDTVNKFTVGDGKVKENFVKKDLTGPSSQKLSDVSSNHLKPENSLKKKAACTKVATEKNLKSKENMLHSVIQEPLTDPIEKTTNKNNLSVKCDKQERIRNIQNNLSSVQTSDLVQSAFTRTKPSVIAHQESLGFDPLSPISPLKDHSGLDLTISDGRQGVCTSEKSSDHPNISGKDDSESQVSNFSSKIVNKIINSAESLSKQIPEHIVNDTDTDISEEISTSKASIPTFGSVAKRTRKSRKQSSANKNEGLSSVILKKDKTSNNSSVSSIVSITKTELEFSPASSPVPSPSTYFSVSPFRICQPISPLPPSPVMHNEASDEFVMQIESTTESSVSLTNKAEEMAPISDTDSVVEESSGNRNDKNHLGIRRFSSVAPPDAVMVKPRCTSMNKNKTTLPCEALELPKWRNKKRPSLEIISSPPQKKMCIEDQTAPRTTTGGSLDGAIDREIEQEFKAYLNSEVSVEDFVSKLFKDRHIGATLLSLSKVIVYVLQCNSKDMFQSLYEQCANDCCCSPCLTDTEIRILKFLKILTDDKNINFEPETVLQPLWNSIFSTAHTPLMGKLATCRMFTAICLLKGDLEQARILFYHVLMNGNLSYACIAVTISGVWPEVLKKSLDACCMSSVFELIVIKALEKSNQRHQKMHQCLRNLCQWSDKINMSSEELLQSFMKTLQNIYHPIPDFTVQVSSFEICKSIKLLCVMEGWSWANSKFLTRHSNSISNKWKRKAEECGLSKEYLITMLRLMGHFNSQDHIVSVTGLRVKEARVPGENQRAVTSTCLLANVIPPCMPATVIQSCHSAVTKEVNVLLRSFFLPMLKVQSSWTEVNNCIIETAIELSPFSPVLVFQSLNELKKKNPSQFPFELRHRAENAFQFLHDCQTARFRFISHFI